MKTHPVCNRGPHGKCLKCVFQELQESEVCQDELALRVKQLKTELVLFKGLVSNVSLPLILLELQSG